MQARDAGNALAVALISILLMIGALSISLVEFVPEATPTETNIVPPSPLPLTVTSTIEPSATPLVFETPSASPAIAPTDIVIPSSSCPIPLGWRQINVRYGDTLDGIAARYRVNKNELKNANCLLSENLIAGTILYAPPVATNTPALCNSGAAGWVHAYIVKSGDTFYAIASNYGTSSATLKYVNCRVSDLIYVGEILWVPNVATRTPYPTLFPSVTATPFPTEPLTETALPFTGTPLPSETSLPPTPVPTDTFEPTPTPTAFQ